ncbi:MAG: hypothetical protein ACOCP8_03340 [archaeon]
MTKVYFKDKETVEDLSDKFKKVMKKRIKNVIENEVVFLVKEENENKYKQITKKYFTEGKGFEKIIKKISKNFRTTEKKFLNTIEDLKINDIIKEKIELFTIDLKDNIEKSKEEIFQNKKD